MRVGIFVENIGKKGGGPETYEIHLLRNLAILNSSHTFYIFSHYRDIEEILNIHSNQFKFVLLRPSSRLISYAITLPILLKKYEIDICHYTFIPSIINPVPFIFTHHCFSPFNHPEFYPKFTLLRLNFLLKRGINNSKKIICVSENVKTLTHQLCEIPLEKMIVIHEGIDRNFLPTPGVDKRKWSQVINHPYFLFIGKLSDRKNISRILQAFHQFKLTNNATHKLVLIGSRQEPLNDLDQLFESLNIKDDVVEIPHMNHTQLPDWYSNAECFLFPSLWEGFGLPVLEAFNCGVPVITSNHSSLPEIAGDAAMLVDPYNVKQIALAMEEIINNKSTSEKLVEAGYRRIEHFSWEKMAEKTLELYEEEFLK